MDSGIETHQKKYVEDVLNVKDVQDLEDVQPLKKLKSDSGANEPVSIMKGSGSQLKDTPNGKAETDKKAKAQPTIEEMNPVVVSILQKVGKTLYKSYAKALNSDSKQTALQILREEQPRHFIFCYRNVNKHLDRAFRPDPTAYVSPYPMSSFTNVPQDMQKWADDYFSSDSASRPWRPKSIIIEGDSRTGKTLWARSLGKHNYFAGDFGLDFHSNDAEYNVIDNINPKSLKHWKELLGAKETGNQNASTEN